MDVNFYSMPDIVNFTLGAEFFCIPVNTLEFCSGMQLSYLGVVPLRFFF